MAIKAKEPVTASTPPEGRAREEIDRINARLRHFRGVAAGVMGEALGLWVEIWDACQDPRSCEEILEDVPAPRRPNSPEEWAEWLNKLHLLGTYIDYAKRLCEGSIDHQTHKESEVEAWLDSSRSFQTANHPSIMRFCRPKKE